MELALLCWLTTVFSSHPCPPGHAATRPTCPFLWLLLALLGSGCAARSAATSRFPHDVTLPEHVHAGNYRAARRDFFRLKPGDARRHTLRQTLVAHLDAQGKSLLQHGSYESIVAHFARLTSLYTPAEFDKHTLSPTLIAPARIIARDGARRGREAEVLAALLVLQRLQANKHARARYRRLAHWGLEARQSLPNPIEGISRTIALWQDHAQLSPANSVLRRLIQLHRKRRMVLLAVFQQRLGQDKRSRGLGQHTLSPLLARTSLDIAAVYLEHADIDGAYHNLKRQRDATSAEVRIVEVLQIARGADKAARQALNELAAAYQESRPEVSRGICRIGHRRFPTHVSFPLCLARAATQSEAHLDALAWYDVAIGAAPERRPVYDEALAQINDLIEEGLFSADASEARLLATQAEKTLKERLKRWPKAPAPITPERLHLLVGLLEMNAGHPERAKRRFRASVATRENAAALVQLGVLEMRTQHLRTAIQLFERATHFAEQEQKRERVTRLAEIAEHLGDAHRKLRQTTQARSHYKHALKQWNSLVPRMAGPALALAHIRRGVLLDRLGDRRGATIAFRRAMAAAPDWREPYAGVLAHLTTSKPDAALAHDVFRRAQRQLSLEPEWKVYFALWVQIIAARQGVPTDPDVLLLLGDLAKSNAWWGKLAAFAAGKLPYAGLLQAAQDNGQRTEAHFYEGIRRLTHKDPHGAKRLLRKVLATHMVSFYEFTMADELLHQ